MTQKVLVAYATKHGSTAEIAAAIGDAINAGGMQADVRPARDVKTLDGYDAVVVGSAVYMGRWQDDGIDFLKHFERDLKARRIVWVPVALLDIAAVIGYFAMGNLRDPAFEVWGLLTKAAQVVMLGALVYLTFRAKPHTD